MLVLSKLKGKNSSLKLKADHYFFAAWNWSWSRSPPGIMIGRWPSASVSGCDVVDKGGVCRKRQLRGQDDVLRVWKPRFESLAGSRASAAAATTTTTTDQWLLVGAAQHGDDLRQGEQPIKCSRQESLKKTFSFWQVKDRQRFGDRWRVCLGNQEVSWVRTPPITLLFLFSL